MTKVYLIYINPWILFLNWSGLSIRALTMKALGFALFFIHIGSKIQCERYDQDFYTYAVKQLKQINDVESLGHQKIVQSSSSLSNRNSSLFEDVCKMKYLWFNVKALTFVLVFKGYKNNIQSKQCDPVQQYKLSPNEEVDEKWLLCFDKALWLKIRDNCIKWWQTNFRRRGSLKLQTLHICRYGINFYKSLLIQYCA